MKLLMKFKIKILLFLLLIPVIFNVTLQLKLQFFPMISFMFVNSSNSSDEKFAANT